MLPAESNKDHPKRCLRVAHIRPGWGVAISNFPHHSISLANYRGLCSPFHANSRPPASPLAHGDFSLQQTLNARILTLSMLANWGR